MKRTVHLCFPVSRCNYKTAKSYFSYECYLRLPRPQCLIFIHPRQQPGSPLRPPTCCWHRTCCSRSFTIKDNLCNKICPAHIPALSSCDSPSLFHTPETWRLARVASLACGSTHPPPYCSVVPLHPSLHLSSSSASSSSPPCHSCFIWLMMRCHRSALEWARIPSHTQKKSVRVSLSGCVCV